MPVNISTLTPAFPANDPRGRAAAEAERGLAGRTEAAEAQRRSRAQSNASIVEASLTVSITAQNEPLALLFRSAIEAINEALKPELGDNAIQNAVNRDQSPEATAERIVALSTGFFDAFRAQHEGEDDGDVLKNFLETIRGGFERGFNEARDILEGLGVLSGEVAKNVERTYERVQQGYASFEKAHSGEAVRTTGV